MILQQVLFLLIITRLRRWPESLSIAVRLHPGRRGCRPQAGNSHIEIRVSDTGSSIAPEVRAYVFERFQKRS